MSNRSHFVRAGTAICRQEVQSRLGCQNLAELRISSAHRPTDGQTLTFAKELVDARPLGLEGALLHVELVDVGTALGDVHVGANVVQLIDGGLFAAKGATGRCGTGNGRAEGGGE